MNSQIIAEVAIVDCRAFVAVVFSTSPGTKVADGFFYILNGYALQLHRISQRLPWRSNTAANHQSLRRLLQALL